MARRVRTREGSQQYESFAAIGGVSVGRAARGRGVFGQVAGPPQVPTGYGAVGRPALAAPEDLVGFGQVGGFDGARFGDALKGEREAFAHAVVGYGQHIGAAQAEDEQHLHGPGADAANFGKAFDDVGVAHLADSGAGGHGAVEGARGKVAQGLDLVAGDAGGAERVVGRVE